MSGTTRLLAGEATDFERQLLGSWAAQGPSEAARARVLAIAGGVSAGLLTSAGVAAAKVTTTSMAPKAAAGLSAAFVKWVAVGLVCATATGGAVAVVRHQAAIADDRASVPRADEPTVPVVAAAPRSDTAPSDPMKTIALVPDPAVVGHPRAAPAARSSTLDDEVAIIDQARRAITAGDPAAALQIVGAYDARYPGGALSQESTEIRIESLLAQGNRATAERLGSKFILLHPSSPYVHRIRALLGEPKTP